MVALVNTNPEIQAMVKGMKLSGVIELIDVNETLHMSIDNGKAEAGSGSISNPDFFFKGDLPTITKVLLGDLDPVTAYFSEVVEAEGDLEEMLKFMSVLEVGLDLLKIIKKGEMKTIIPIEKMKELLGAYNSGPDAIKPEHVPDFLKVLAAFINVNPEAQEEIEDTDMRISIKLEEAGEFNLLVEDNKMTILDKGFNGDTTLSLSMPLSTMIDVMFDGDAVSAYMAGQISVDGDLSQAMLFQSIMELLIEYIEK